jgi:hypothetical protein
MIGTTQATSECAREAVEAGLTGSVGRFDENRARDHVPKQTQTIPTIIIGVTNWHGFHAASHAVRQRAPGSGEERRTVLLEAFRWGRLDEANCQVQWVSNLPGFRLNAAEKTIPQRCQFADRAVAKSTLATVVPLNATAGEKAGGR